MPDLLTPLQPRAYLLPSASGGVELGKPEYSGGVRQELHRVAEHMQQGDIEIYEGSVPNYFERMMKSRWAGGLLCSKQAWL
jgi:hypothetical protein